MALTAATLDPVLRDFAGAVGVEGPVCVEGGRTQWTVGGLPEAATRAVRAPAGVCEYHPAEMTLRAYAGTTLAELDAAVAPAGQATVLDGPPDATIGGILAVGRSGLRRRRVGPLRDGLLQLRYVSADGRLVTAGGPTVKNVTGYDLCRLMVGSLGLLGCFAEVIVRTRPRPPVSQWWVLDGDPFAVSARLYRPSSVLWNGSSTWVWLEGHGSDVAAQGALVASFGGRECDGPPPLPPQRSSVAPAEVAAVVASGQAGGCVAEVGVGIIHGERALPRSPAPRPIVALHERLRDQFDPSRRLNPGRSVLGH